MSSLESTKKEHGSTLLDIICGQVIYSDHNVVVRMIEEVDKRVIHTNLIINGYEVVPSRYVIGQTKLVHKVY